MFVKRALGLGLLALTGVAVAQQGLRFQKTQEAPAPARNPNQFVGRMYSPAEIADLKVEADELATHVRVARQPTVKTPTADLIVADDATGRIIFKVDDAYQTLLQGDGTILSVSGRNVDSIEQVVAQFGLSVKPAITKEPARLLALQRKATLNSGKGQPWLPGMLVAEGPEPILLDAAKALNDLDAVEWVEIETKRYLSVPTACCIPGGQCQVVEPDFCTQELGGTPIFGEATCGTEGLCGACCYPTGVCIEPLTEHACLQDGTLGRTWQGGGSTCDGACAACCDPSDTCATLYTPSGCTTVLGGIHIPGETDCANVDCTQLEEPDCGVGYTGDCYDPAGNGTPYCNDGDCCALVCEIDPWCCDAENPAASWDSICASFARRFCAAGDVCDSPVNGDCFDSGVCDSGGTQVGCSNPDCCNAVCSADPLCCDTAIGCWDAECVTLAYQLCEIPPAGPDTPDYVPLQGYRTPGAYNPVPPDLVPYLPIYAGQPLYGYTGEGFYLMGGEPFEDTNTNGSYDLGEPFTDWDGNLVYTGVGDGSDIYNGLYGLAQELLDTYGVDALGQGNLALGKTVKVGVIEWGYWEGHEDLNVTTEPGQTIIAIEEVTEPDHGTACLSIINGLPNGIGVTGIAPEAEAWFFPLTSIEEGPRELNAWSSAIEYLDPGDVISCSYGPGPAAADINNVQSTWTMIRMAADSGITCCMAAGNACFNLDGSPDLTDSGGIVVGAGSPGFPWYRLAFSNYYQQDDPTLVRSNIVHVHAWGDGLVSGGYGVLYNGTPVPDRSYMPYFNGTSGATPQIAGAVACLQGLAKQFYGIPLTPEQIRASLMDGWLPPDPCSRSLLNCGFPDFCSWDTDPNEGPNLIGPYPCLAGGFGCAGSAILNQSSLGFDDNPLIDGIEILTGTLLYGNVFSIKADDGNNLVVSSALTTPSSPSFSERGSITSGDMTDVLVRAHTLFPRVDDMTISVDSSVSGGAGVLLLYLYSWDYGHWLVAGIDVVGTVDDPGISSVFNVGNARQFIRSGDRQVLIRIQSVSSAYGPDYEVYHDLIHLEAGADPQVPSNGP